jgi:NIMA (never in mitosis gene a)-related kinase
LSSSTSSSLSPSRSSSATSSSADIIKSLAAQPSPEYDFSDEENLPSPFLKRIDREREREKEQLSQATFIREVVKTENPFDQQQRQMARRRPLLRATAALNSADNNRKVRTSISTRYAGDAAGRPSIASARKAGDEARKALARV